MENDVLADNNKLSSESSAYHHVMTTNCTNCTVSTDVIARAYNWPVLLAYLVVVGAIVGNLFVVLAVKQEYRLRNMFNYFLVSLAMSDLLSAILVMPVTITKAFIGNLHEPKVLCLTWYALDVFFTSSTIMHLTVISIDRFMALRYPLKYGASRRSCHTLCRIACVWILASLLAGPLFFSTWLFNDSDAKQEAMAFKGCGPENNTFILPAVLISFYLPFAIMTCMYCATVWTLHKQSKHQAKLQLRKITVFSKDDSSKGSSIASKRKSLNSSQRSAPQPSVHTDVTVTSDATSHATTASSRTLQLPLLSKCESTDSQSSTGVASEFKQTSFNGDSKQNHHKPGALNGTAPSAAVTQDASTLVNDDDAASSSDITHDEESTQSNSASDQPPSSSIHRQPSLAWRLRSKLRMRTERGRHSSARNRHVRLRGVNSQDRNRHAVTVLGVLFLVFVIFYLPFFVTYTIRALCSESCAHDTLDQLIQVFEILGYGGSAANPIVYHVFSKEFREVFYKIVKCKTCMHNR